MKYTLHDLEVTTAGDPTTYNCSHIYGQGLVVKGENIEFIEGTKHFSHYSLATLIPYIAAKQRPGNKNDWMYSECEIACPDPICGAVFRIERKGLKTYNYKPIK